MDTETMLCKGVVERIGEQNARLVHELVVNGEGKTEKTEFIAPIADHTEAFRKVLKALTDPKLGVIKDVSEIKAVGHRVLHSGEDFTDSVLIDDTVIAICKKNAVLGPLHMPANIACIESCRKIMPETPMVAVFDTGFHLTMPKYAYMYGIPYADYEKYKIRKYGFHGTSHKYVSGAVRKILGENDTRRMITCHLGNGSSLAAVKDGKCIDTSMGLTPLEGLVMGTRSGDLDPAVVEFMCKCKNMTVSEVLNILNKESGFKGIAGVSDCRDLCQKAEKGDEFAQLALDMFAYRIKKYIGSYYIALGGLDCVVFTGGIGENSNVARSMIMKGLDCIGIDFDFEKNDSAPRGRYAVLSKPSSKVKVVVMPTNEELVIARDAVRLSGLK
jgi:acetate kinase